MSRTQDSLYVRLQENEINRVIIPNNYTPIEIITIGLLRCINPRLINFEIAKKSTVKQVDIDDIKTLTLNLGGSKDSFNFDSEDQKEKTGIDESVFSMVYKELKEFFPEYIKESFEEDIIFPTEKGGTLYKYIEKILNQGTSVAFSQAIKEAHHFIKIWTIYK